MVDAKRILPHMIVVCSDGEEIAEVEHLEGASAIKLTRDETGQHHFVPLVWVASVDERVHLDRPARAVREQWTTAES